MSTVGAVRQTWSLADEYRQPPLAGLPPIACIVGAPRCGTTTFARWLSRREEVCFSKVKEPHFFTLVDLTEERPTDLAHVIQHQYLDRFFPHRSPGIDLLAEGSVSYLYAPERLKPLLRVWPGAKFIIALRDPFELLPSLHQRLLFQCDEVVSDFTLAWQLQEARSQGRNIPASCVEARQLQYLEVARLGKHVERFFEVIGQSNCHVVLFDDLLRDPTDTYIKLLSFLGLKDDGFRDFQVNRPSREFRFFWLQRLLKRPTIFTKLMLTGRAFQHRFGAERPKEPTLIKRTLARARRKLLKWNERQARTKRIPALLRSEIRSLLQDDVRALSKLIGRNLNHWLGGLTNATWGEGAAGDQTVVSTPDSIGTSSTSSPNDATKLTHFPRAIAGRGPSVTRLTDSVAGAAIWASLGFGATALLIQLYLSI